MAIVNFEAFSAELFASMGEFEKKSPGLSFGVRLAQRESIKLASGEKFEDLDGRVTVLPDTEAPGEDQKGFGTLHHFAACDDDFDPFPPSFIVQTVLPKHQFNELLSAAKLGRVPSVISVDIEGMEYDWQPDGSGKKWDNKTSPKLDVKSVRFNVPLASLSQDTDAEPRLCDNAMPPTRLQFEQLSQGIDRQGIEISKALKALLWAIIILGGVVVLLRW